MFEANHKKEAFGLAMNSSACRSHSADTYVRAGVHAGVRACVRAGICASDPVGLLVLTQR